MAGLTDKGISIKRLPEVVGDLRKRAEVIFQDLLEDPNDIVDTSDDSTIGRFIGLIAPALTELWETDLDIYSAFNPHTAVGIPLDNIVAIGGITRREESFTTAEVYLTGNPGTNITTGLVVSSPSTSAFYEITQGVILDADVCHGVGVEVANFLPETDYSVFYKISDSTVFKEIKITTGLFPTVDGIFEDLMTEIVTNHPTLRVRREDNKLFIESGIELQLLSFYTSFNLSITKVIGIGRVQASEAGEIVQGPNTITNISTPILGWDSVRNPLQAETGSHTETDEELRNRFRESKFQRATNIMEALYSSLYNTSGVDAVIIYENDTDETDARGLPPHSFWTIVDGGVDTDVARAIWLNRPTGITGIGNVAVDIVDSFGYIRTVKFSRPELVEVFVRLSITTNQDFPQGGQEEIKTNLSEYVNSLAINETLVYSRLYTPINKVKGHQVDSLEVSLDGEEWTTANILVGLDQKAYLPASNVSFV